MEQGLSEGHWPSLRAQLLQRRSGKRRQERPARARMGGLSRSCPRFGPPGARSCCHGGHLRRWRNPRRLSVLWTLARFPPPSWCCRAIRMQSPLRNTSELKMTLAMLFISNVLFLSLFYIRLDVRPGEVLEAMIGEVKVGTHKSWVSIMCSLMRSMSASRLPAGLTPRARHWMRRSLSRRPLSMSLRALGSMTACYNVTSLASTSHASISWEQWKSGFYPSLGAYKAPSFSILWYMLAEGDSTYDPTFAF